MFVSTLREIGATGDRQYRFRVHRKDGQVLEPQYYLSLERDGGRLWEKFTFDMRYDDREIDHFRLQSRRAERGQKLEIPVARDEIAATRRRAKDPRQAKDGSARALCAVVRRTGRLPVRPGFGEPAHGVILDGRDVDQAAVPGGSAREPARLGRSGPGGVHGHRPSADAGFRHPDGQLRSQRQHGYVRALRGHRQRHQLARNIHEASAGLGPHLGNLQQ